VAQGDDHPLAPLECRDLPVQADMLVVVEQQARRVVITGKLLDDLCGQGNAHWRDPRTGPGIQASKMVKHRTADPRAGECGKGCTSGGAVVVKGQEQGQHSARAQVIAIDMWRERAGDGAQGGLDQGLVGNGDRITCGAIAHGAPAVKAVLGGGRWCHAAHPIAHVGARRARRGGYAQPV